MNKVLYFILCTFMGADLMAASSALVPVGTSSRVRLESDDDLEEITSAPARSRRMPRYPNESDNSSSDNSDNESNSDNNDSDSDDSVVSVVHQPVVQRVQNALQIPDPRRDIRFEGPGIDWSTQEGVKAWANAQLVVEQGHGQEVAERQRLLKENTFLRTKWFAASRLKIYNGIFCPAIRAGKSLLQNTSYALERSGSGLWHIGKFPLGTFATTAITATAVEIVKGTLPQQKVNLALGASLIGGVALGAIFGPGQYRAAWAGEEALRLRKDDARRFEIMAAGLAHVDNQRRTLDQARAHLDQIQIQGQRVEQVLNRQREEARLMREEFAEAARQAEARAEEARVHREEQERLARVDRIVQEGLARERTQQLREIQEQLAKDSERAENFRRQITEQTEAIARNQEYLEQQMQEHKALRDGLARLHDTVSANHVVNTIGFVSQLAVLRGQLLGLRMQLEHLSLVSRFAYREEYNRVVALHQNIFGVCEALVRQIRATETNQDVVRTTHELLGGESAVQAFRGLLDGCAQDLARAESAIPHSYHFALPVDLNAAQHEFEVLGINAAGQVQTAGLGDSILQAQGVQDAVEVQPQPVVVVPTPLEQVVIQNDTAIAQAPVEQPIQVSLSTTGVKITGILNFFGLLGRRS